MPPASDPVTERVHSAASGLSVLLAEAEAARAARAETAGRADGAHAGSGESADGPGGGAVCAWNHFENIPTFYNWNNRPR